MSMDSLTIHGFSEISLDMPLWVIRGYPWTVYELSMDIFGLAIDVMSMDHHRQFMNTADHPLTPLDKSWLSINQRYPWKIHVYPWIVWYLVLPAWNQVPSAWNRATYDKQAERRPMKVGPSDCVQPALNAPAHKVATCGNLLPQIRRKKMTTSERTTERNCLQRMYDNEKQIRPWGSLPPHPTPSHPGADIKCC